MKKKKGLTQQLLMTPRMARLWHDIHPDKLGLLESARRREFGLTSEDLYPSSAAYAAGPSRPDEKASRLGKQPSLFNSRNSEQEE